MACFSAPGKALLAGGYLVLFPEYTAYSVALSSRMHAVVSPPARDGDDASDANASDKLVVHSPQFDSRWEYDVTGRPRATFETHRNPFVDSVLAVVHAYYGKLKGGAVQIFSDDGFHSQRESTPSTVKRFRNHDRAITEVPKTGLGSSAALAVVLTAALVSFQAELDLNNPEHVRLVHNLAQIAHCVAQGKVGSGFDVATAVYGSIEYSRFDPSCIPGIVEPNAVKTAANASWKMLAKPIAFPRAFTLLMGDVSGGSETPSMVKNLLSWRAEHPEEASEIWDRLSAANSALCHSLDTHTDAHSLREIVGRIRTQLQLMTAASGVPIEPREQTRVLNAALTIDGVVNGVVPGAGGHDAVCLICETADLARIKKELRDNPDLQHVQWLDIEQEPHGLVAEPESTYR